MAASNSTADSSRRPRVTRILIVDDHPLIRRGVTEMLARETDLTVTGEAETEAEALTLIRSGHPDLIIMDLALREGNGLNLIRRVRALGIGTPILVLSMRDGNLFAQRVIRAGAQGFVSKGDSSDMLISAIRQVLRHELAVSPGVTSRLLQWAVASQSGKRVQAPTVDQLTDRELEIFEMVGRGLSVADIARRLKISAKTVQAHRENIKMKLELGTSTELLRYAVLWTDGGLPEREGQATAEPGSTASPGE